MIEDSIDGYLPVAWLQKHNADANWKTGQVKWQCPYCVENCLPNEVNALLVDKAQLVKEVQDCTNAFVATIEWRTQDGLEVLKVVPVENHKWASIFSREQTNKLHSHQGFDNCIKLVDGAQAPWGPLYGILEQELRGLLEWLDKQMAAGKISKTNSSADALILLVNKPDGSFHL